jgi:hypothetical protein
MNSAISFVELENRVVSATYRNLMVRAKVLLVEKASGAALTEPVTTITSTLPNAALRIRLPEGIKPGSIFSWRATHTAKKWPEAPASVLANRLLPLSFQGLRRMPGN